MADPIHAGGLDELETLRQIVRGARYAMLAHKHDDGTIRAHPLTTIEAALGEGALRFFVARDTELGRRIQEDGNVCLSYSNAENDQWASIAGWARVVDDLAKKRELFGAMSKAWFPGGPEDPNLELVEVAIKAAEYWDVKDSKVTQAWKMAKAVATGVKPRMGEHREIEMGKA